MSELFAINLYLYLTKLLMITYYEVHDSKDVFNAYDIPKVNLHMNYII